MSNLNFEVIWYVKIVKKGGECEIVKSFFAVFVKSTGHIEIKICTVYHINII